MDALFAEAELEPTFSVGELSETIGLALQRAFPREVWVKGEILNLQRPSSGHVYFDLVGDGARLRVTLWASDKRLVNAVLRRAGGAVRMTDGTEVRLRAQVTWWRDGGTASLRMTSVDPAYTLGRLAEAREALIARLRSEGVLDRQQSLVVPLVPLRVGLVTSDGSAAAADFLRTLDATAHGWQVVLADARVQGPESPGSVAAALVALGRHQPPLDVVCVVRGGGAKTDLAAFDTETVVRAIAACPVAVLTGIGHEIDQAVADLAAHRSFKTPTACAAHLVEQVEGFRSRVEACRSRLASTAQVAVVQAERRLEHRSARIGTAARSHLRSQEHRLGLARAQLVTAPLRRLDGAGAALDGRAAHLRALDPVHQLARGWSITRGPDGAVVRSIADLPPGAEATTTVADGTVHATVVGTRPATSPEVGPHSPEAP